MTNDELIARVDGLTGPDREVDALLWIECGPDNPDFTRYGWADGWSSTYVPDERLTGYVRQVPIGPGGVNGMSAASRPSPTFTASVDTSLALVERELPGWHVQLTQLPDHWAASLWDSNTDMGMERFPGNTACAAILAALLRARAKSGDGR